MPRKDFQRDLAKSSVPYLFAHLRDVRSGNEDGSIYLTYQVPFDTQTIDFQVSVPDTSEYPRDHTYFAFAASDSIPEAVSSALEQFQPADCTLTIVEFLEHFSKRLDAAILELASPTGSSGEIDLEDDVDGETGFLSEDEIDWEDEEKSFFNARPDARTVISEVREDLRVAKEAGYKVGYLGHATGSVMISVSCRIAKLGISIEAMKAWDVSPLDYLVLLIRYPQGYTRMKDILGKGSSSVEMHVGACEKYKPGLDEARMLFNASSKPSSDDSVRSRHSGAPLKPIFIGNSLQSLLNKYFIDLLAYRLDYGFKWTSAELFLNNNQGRIQDKARQDSQRPEYHTPEHWDESTPAFLKADHISDDLDPSSSSLSFPLLAMQFTLRRFVKCVDFCLNCYCKIDTGFEALKPYVCSKGLCLYQYMKLGMGPNIEWEILSQPYVVDILVSFAYARASANHLDDFPTGLGLKVPCFQGKQAHAGKLDLANMRLRVDESVTLKTGDWVVLTKAVNQSPLGTDSQWHCRVMNTVFAPSYELASPVHRSKSPTMHMTSDVQFMVYDTNFDALDDRKKREAICMLLDTLPDVDQMRSFLTSERAAVSGRSLVTWTERISPAALYVLRWIVSSNRSCIRYEENPEDRVSGVPGWMQFRLAQGAPDKEHRFVHSVTSTTNRLKLKHSTLFAWHGSALHNWHSILREGLHFNYVAHGRAYGNGVYMSPNFDLSLGYTAGGTIWPNSLLKVSKAIVLNEVVNAPGEFVTSQGCYVVSQLDWIQSRYLFVECKDSTKYSGATAARSFYDQDPNRRAFGCQNEAVAIPLSALSSRRMATASDSPTKVAGRAKKLKLPAKDSKDNDDDDASSVMTLLEDRMLLDWGTDEELQKRYGEGDFDNRPLQNNSSLTDFRPGTLRESSVKLLGPPQYATTKATKVLQQHLQETLKVQEREPLHELGWYIDHHLIENVYQWIVELHSFDPSLPLAKDLKKLGLTSVVLELRFPPQFPMSPPFVRVIRPRFVMFSQGGGGHITPGGALCMELLTTSGWSPVSSIEAVLLQVRMAITSTDPRPARLQMSDRSDYSVGEAIDAYVRVCRVHNWQVPADLQRVSWT
ncbi:putative ubiquitin conjugating enzyme [Aspergillus melleus]|uniref:putative ubiquitin conjugating enzyme n=1 Tax=Aspergillus melleus TaxID=138277 RepID=UPI001E8D1026|nr:uncharacterized protein LDX57_010305 [Aspergillus melleus]KAH8432678.1 hypothetical protein LDX57_010305 [Aspergillus melleus]